MKKGNLIDDGITCTSTTMLQRDRLMRMVNGSGFDELDAVEASLECRERFEDEEISEFDDPLAIIIAEEDAL
jgi:hypothetical protein